MVAVVVAVVVIVAIPLTWRRNISAKHPWAHKTATKKIAAIIVSYLEIFLAMSKKSKPFYKSKSTYLLAWNALISRFVDFGWQHSIRDV